MKPAVVCIGAVTLDLIVIVDDPLEEDTRIIASEASLGSGGPSATAAVTLARLGVDVAYVGDIGNDEASTYLHRQLDEAGVDISAVSHGPGQPAMSVVLVNPTRGSRSIAAYYGTISPPHITDRVVDMARGAEWVHVDHRGWAAVPILRERGIATPISVDHGNPTPGLDLSLVTLYSPTERKLREIYPDGDLGDAMARAMADGAEMVVVTRGSRGAVAVSRPTEAANVEFLEVAPIRTEVRSTLGAGDVFHGALLASLLRGDELGRALQLANACAALSCRALDGRSGIPDREELDRFVGGLERAAVTKKPSEG